MTLQIASIFARWPDLFDMAAATGRIGGVGRRRCESVTALSRCLAAAGADTAGDDALGGTDQQMRMDSAEKHSRCPPAIRNATYNITACPESDHHLMTT